MSARCWRERPGTGAAGLLEELDRPELVGVSRHRPAVRPVRTDPALGLGIADLGSSVRLPAKLTLASVMVLSS